MRNLPTILGVAALLVTACSGLTAIIPDPTPTPHATQVPLPATGHDFEIHLQDGFQGDRVRIRVDGALVYDGMPQTNPVLGLAETLGWRAANTTFALTVEVPAQGINHTQTLSLDDGLAVGITLYQGQVLVVQANGFAYE